MNPRDLPSSPAADRNKGPILALLQQWLPPTANVLEIASGTGQHAQHFATAQPRWTWMPSDTDPALLAAIAARCGGLANVQAPLPLDVLQPWPPLPCAPDAVYCANLLHISPWATCAALMQGVAARLEAGGCLVLYGPYVVDGRPTAPSNVAFDADLRARNPEWGLRRLADVESTARQAGLVLAQQVDMPANNLLLRWRRAA